MIYYQRMNGESRIIKRVIKSGLWGACSIIFFISGTQFVYAYPSKKEPVRQEVPVVLELSPGEIQEISFTFKNTGVKKWQGTKRAPLTLRSSAQRESYLYESSWYSKIAPLKIGKTIKSNSSLKVSFVIQAPETQGTYQDRFTLFLGNKKLSPSHVAVTLLVAEKKVSIKKEEPKVRLASLDPPVQTPAPPVLGQSVAGKALLQSAQSLTLQPYEKIEFHVGFKNNGASAWKKEGADTVTLRSSAKKESYFYDQSWHSQTIVSRLQYDALTGWVSYFTFVLQAPSTSGQYTETLALYYNEEKIPDSELTIPISVTQPVVAPATPVILASAVTPAQEIIQPSLPVSGIVNEVTEQEPIIRVGYFHTREPIRITAQKPYEVRTEKGDLLATLAQGEISTVVFNFITQQYSLVTSTTSTETPYYLKFGPQQLGAQVLEDNDLIFEITSYQNRPGWTTAINDNKLRNRVEVRYAQKTDRLWLINELGFESYLKGIAETSNNSPQEFQKTLIIAARTFGKYHIQRGTKHAGDNVTVFATDADQIYRGYNAEIRLPNVTKAVDETKGVMVFYNNNLAITPYYSQSDGRTRSWTEVWGGDPKPWLIGKDDPCCTNLPMLGHGVGMSARGAVKMALEGKNFEEILKYYYTGIELRKRY